LIWEIPVNNQNSKQYDLEERTREKTPIIKFQNSNCLSVIWSLGFGI